LLYLHMFLDFCVVSTQGMGTTYCLVGSSNADNQILSFKHNGKVSLRVILTDLFDVFEEVNEVKVIDPPPLQLKSSLG
jgi:hypothetical protein